MSLAARLRRLGVLGINRRNSVYTSRWNRREHYPSVDDKLETKRLLRAAGIPTAPVLAVARANSEVRQMLAALDPLASFVIKPAHGAMGNGVLVLLERDGDWFLSSGGQWLDRRALSYHSESIISGAYALGGQPDAAFAEERLCAHEGFAEIASAGVPDVRVVVFRGVPVMAMTRLPTTRSRGRANLHQGAVGAGVELDSGVTSFAVCSGRPVEVHPDTQRSVLARKLPEFERVLEIAVRASDQTALGYVGADVVVDAARGPLVLE
ncbi:MAG TPA: sugar-transfer associated ATP-grasp domain-containing protein, partial [Myxococcota bacterium]|nr:sugar-transfer associated ATP-grasp domain-containing protein [Myxococcota bacterium]